VEADTPGVALHVRRGTSNVAGSVWTAGSGGFGYGSVSGTAALFDDVCRAPCDAALPPGEHRLGLSYAGGSVHELAEPLTLRGPMTLRAHYESRAGLRLLGLGTIVGSLAGGGAMFLAAQPHTEKRTIGTNPDGTRAYEMRETTRDDGLAQAGIGVMIGGSLLGLVLACLQDSVRLEAMSLASSPTKDAPTKPTFQATLGGFGGTF
jgi:hypothetical protein